MLLTHFIWQTVLKPLSGTNAKNGAITPSLTPTIHTIHARCYKASECGDVHFCVQLPVCCLLILQCLCVHQMVGRWICVCVSVCVRAPHKRLSARAFALTARKKRRLTSYWQFTCNRTYYIRVGGEESGGMCYERRRAEACVD